MANRWLVDQKTRLTNLFGHILFMKPRNAPERWLQSVVRVIVPDNQKGYMQDEMVDADIEFDADELRRYRDSD